MYRQRPLLALAMTLCCAAVLAGPAGPAGPGMSNTGSPALDRALLAEDWKAVVRATAVTDGPQDDAARRALRAHALMLTNQNNGSVTLFLSLDEAARRAWSQWTADFVDRYPAEPVAYYLRGDALARSGDWSGARQALAVALGAQTPRVHALRHPAAASIADGVALIQLGWTRDADQVLLRATAEAPELAEAFASLGTSQLLRSAARGAAESFRRALALAPDDALAINGLACAEYGLGNPEKADAGFAEAARQLPLALFTANRRALRAAHGGGDVGQADTADPGMQLTLTRGLVDQQTYKDGLSPAQIVQGQWNMDHLGRPVADAIGGFVGDQLNRHFEQSTRTNERAMQRQGLSLDDHRPGGVTTDQSHTHVDQGHWPVSNWFGLVLTVAPEPAAGRDRP
jgi:tetratricopeptide (TPR) repeat protein